MGQEQLHGDYAISCADFETLTWKLKRLGCDARGLYPRAAKEHAAALGSKSSPKTTDAKQDKTVLLQKLRQRRRREHARWAASAFKTLDLDHNGVLNRMELGTAAFLECIRTCLGGHLPDGKDVGSLADFVLGHAGDRQHITCKEFDKFTWQVKHMTSDVDFETEFIFALFDPNRDGKIDLAEFERLFNFSSRGGAMGASKEYIEFVMKELDEDGDGSITPSEYRRWSAQSTDPIFQAAAAASVEPVELPKVSTPVTSKKKQSAHRRWACDKFAKLRPRLDVTGQAYITRKDIIADRFLGIVQECLPGRVVQPVSVMPLVKFVLQKSSTDNNFCISYDEFVMLTWRLKRLDADKVASTPASTRSRTSRGSKCSFHLPG